MPRHQFGAFTVGLKEVQRLLRAAPPPPVNQRLFDEDDDDHDNGDQDNDRQGNDNDEIDNIANDMGVDDDGLVDVDGNGNNNGGGGHPNARRPRSRAPAALNYAPELATYLRSLVAGRPPAVAPQSADHNRTTPLRPDEANCMAFCAVRANRLDVLKCLIRECGVAVTVLNHKGRNLLHCAVSVQNFRIFMYLVKTDPSATLHPSPRGYRSPLEIALLSNLPGFVEYVIGEWIGRMDVLGGGEGCDAERLRATRAIERVMRVATQCGFAEVALDLFQALRHIDIFERCLYRDIPLEDKMAVARSFGWWEERFAPHSPPFSRKSAIFLYYYLTSAITKDRAREVKWLLDDWGLKLAPSAHVGWTGYSATDIKSLPGCFIEDFHKRYRVDVEADKNNNADATGFSTLLPSLKDDLDTLVSVPASKNGWDGRTGSLSKCLRKHRRGDGPWILALKSHKSSQWLQTMEALALHPVSATSRCLWPRLDLLVIYGRLRILQWVDAKGKLDLQGPLYHEGYNHARREAAAENDDAEMAELDDAMPEDPDFCSVCYCRRKDTFRLDCGHEFCRPCLQKLVRTDPEQAQGRVATEGSLQCPLCRRQHLVEENDLFRAFERPFGLCLVETASWMNFDSDDMAVAVRAPTIGDALLALAVAVGNIYVLDWLIRCKGLDPRLPRLKGGATLMHIAISLDVPISVKWLVCNGFASMLTSVADSRGKTALDILFETENRSASLIFIILKDCGGDDVNGAANLLPPDYRERCLASPNEELVSLAKSMAKRKKYDEVVSRWADFVKIASVQAIETFANEHLGFMDECEIQRLYDVALDSGRKDVVTALAHSLFPYKELLGKLSRAQWDSDNEEDNEVGERSVAALELDQEIQAEREAQYKSADDVCTAVRNAVVAGESVESIQQLLDAASAVWKSLYTGKNQDETKLEVTGWMFWPQRSSAVQACCLHRHYHLLEWILQTEDAAVAATAAAGDQSRHRHWESEAADSAIWQLDVSVLDWLVKRRHRLSSVDVTVRSTISLTKSESLLEGAASRLVFELSHPNRNCVQARSRDHANDLRRCVVLLAWVAGNKEMYATFRADDTATTTNNDATLEKAVGTLLNACDWGKRRHRQGDDDESDESLTEEDPMSEKEWEEFGSEMVLHGVQALVGRAETNPQGWGRLRKGHRAVTPYPFARMAYRWLALEHDVDVQALHLDQVKENKEYWVETQAMQRERRRAYWKERAECEEREKKRARARAAAAAVMEE